MPTEPAKNPEKCLSDGPGVGWEVITPSDTDQLPKVYRAIYLGVAGDIKFETTAGVEDTMAFDKGWHPAGFIRKIFSTGTTAGLLTKIRGVL